MDGKSNGSFWPSYVDIMTTLFAIMLVLFAVSFSRFKIKEQEQKETLDMLQSLVDEYENIITVYSTVGSIDSTKYFGYDEKYLKHLFTIDVEYQMKGYSIVNQLKLDKTDKILADKKREDIIAAGKLIKETILKLENNSSINNNIKFLVVIEGQSSKVGFEGGDWMNNYTLSYLRARYINEFWKQNGIDLEKIPRCELIISGSGEGGVPRIIPNEEELHSKFGNSAEYMREWSKIEEKNQRFLIHIVPVIGNIDVTKEKIEDIKSHTSK